MYVPKVYMLYKPRWPQKGEKLPRLFLLTRKIVAKVQRHPLGAAKCEFTVGNFDREGVKNSHFVLIKHQPYV